MTCPLPFQITTPIPAQLSAWKRVSSKLILYCELPSGFYCVGGLPIGKTVDVLCKVKSCSMFFACVSS